MGVPASSHDGNNPVQVLESLKHAIGNIRENGGPRLLEYSVYRWREHCGPNFDNDIGYRTEAEYQEWKMKEPVATLRNELAVEYSDIDYREAVMIDEIMLEVNEAFDFAEASPFPDAEERYMGEFVNRAAPQLSFASAINEAFHVAMEMDHKVLCYGLGVTDPKGVFGTTTGLEEEFGPKRVFDVPTSENAFTGVGIGASMTGMIPVMTHQRLDFSSWQWTNWSTQRRNGTTCSVSRCQCLLPSG